MDSNDPYYREKKGALSDLDIFDPIEHPTRGIWVLGKYLKALHDVVPHRQPDPRESTISIGPAREAARKAFDAAVREAWDARRLALEAAVDSAFTAHTDYIARRAAIAQAAGSANAVFEHALASATAVHNAAIDDAVTAGIAAAELEKQRQEAQRNSLPRQIPIPPHAYAELERQLGRPKNQRLYPWL